MTRALVLVAVAPLAACGSSTPAATPVAVVSPGGGEPGAAVADDPGGEASAAPADALPAPYAAILEAHNRYRAEHCAPPLAWSEELAQTAQGWADQLVEMGCAFEHSDTRYGENLAAGTTGALSPEGVVEMWYREIDQYDFARGGFAMETGHFTQVVWKATERLGCGKAQCGGMDLWVCNYAPPGNVEGQYRDNVLPTSCR